jgi:hypothetical protein
VSPEIEDTPFRLGERLAAALFIAVGLAASAAFRLYDTGTWMAAVLTAVSGIAGTAIFWLILRALGVPRGRRVAGSVWAALPWNTLLLSQVPYLGFLLIPVEVMVSAIILRARARLPRIWVSLALALVVRLVTFGLVYAARSALRSLFPVDG